MAASIEPQDINILHQYLGSTGAGAAEMPAIPEGTYIHYSSLYNVLCFLNFSKCYSCMTYIQFEYLYKIILVFFNIKKM